MNTDKTKRSRYLFIHVHRRSSAFIGGQMCYKSADMRCRSQFGRAKSKSYLMFAPAFFFRRSYTYMLQPILATGSRILNGASSFSGTDRKSTRLNSSHLGI